MNNRRMICIIGAFAGLLPAIAHAELTFIGRQDISGQGFGNVINVLTLQNNGSESGSVSWNGSGNIVNGSSGSPCNSAFYVACNGPDTGASTDPNKTLTQTFATVGWQNAGSIAVSLNLNQQGSVGGQAITLENLVLNVYNPTNGAVVFSAPLDHPHVFTSIEQGTGTGYFIFELNSAEQATAQAALFGANYNPNYHVGLSALLDNTANAGAETFGIVNANVVPEPGFYGVLALGLSSLCFAVRRRRKRE